MTPLGSDAITATYGYHTGARGRKTPNLIDEPQDELPPVPVRDPSRPFLFVYDRSPDRAVPAYVLAMRQAARERLPF